MKKILTLITVLLGTYTASFAQQQKGDVELGLNIGENASAIIDNHTKFSKSKIGANFGVAADFYLSPVWSFKTKLIFDEKGSHSSFNDENENLNYITVPLMANWHFGKTRNWYLDFGPYLGFLASAKDKADGQTEDIKQNIYSTDIGLAFGVGVKFRLSNKVKIQLESDHQYGFTEIAKHNEGPIQMNSREAFNIGFDFAL